ncbi:hypothetical protein IAU60_006533 [Kwoniella sp. DSM 27419]
MIAHRCFFAALALFAWSFSLAGASSYDVFHGWTAGNDQWVAEVPDLESSQLASWKGFRSVGYFPNCSDVMLYRGIYPAQSFFVTDIHPKDFTHIIYAFANVDANSGNVFLGDDWADTQYPYPGDNTDEGGTNLYGNLKQLFLLKKANRNLKIQLGIGGGTWSPNFKNINQDWWRDNFARSAVALVNDLGFDGLDIDYESNGANHYVLSWATSCGAWSWVDLDIRGMDRYLDFWNLMAYDFSGAWTSQALPASNLYPDYHSSETGASSSQCAQHYISSGVTSRKIDLGMPLYGTGFAETQGMWTPYHGLGGGDYGQSGGYDVKHLPLAGEPVFYEHDLGASWSYNAKDGHVVSFDTPTVAFQKARWAINNQLGGMMYWSIDGDYRRLQPQSDHLLTDPSTMGSDQWDIPAAVPGNASRKCYGDFKGAMWPLDGQPISAGHPSYKAGMNSASTGDDISARDRQDSGGNTEDVMLAADSSLDDTPAHTEEYDNVRNGFR